MHNWLPHFSAVAKSASDRESEWEGHAFVLRWGPFEFESSVVRRLPDPRERAR